MRSQVFACLVAKVFSRLERGSIEDGPIHPRQALLRPPQNVF
jgi:hypothetical protein